LPNGCRPRSAERNALTRKLIEVQDEERRHLARELHDEFGQSLSAIAAQAACRRPYRGARMPAALRGMPGISRTTAHMMETLRGALVRLRPPDVEELGLTISLESLVASWNGFEKGRTRFEIAVIGAADDLPPGVSASLYRIAQEAITNAAKHAHARHVQLRLEAGDADIVLTVEDDGEAAGASLTPTAGWDCSACRSGGFTRREPCNSSGARPAAPGLSRAFPPCGRSLDMAALIAGHAGRTRVMLADDHAIVREGYRSLLQKQDRLQVIAEATTEPTPIASTRKPGPTSSSWTCRCLALAGSRPIRRIRQWDKSARILVFTMHQSAAYAIQAIKAGARGFVTKSNPARGAAARDHRGHGRAHRAQPRHRPRTRDQPARRRAFGDRHAEPA
jgi:ActR/RegA family two-component response regulator/two-component sensor histidine kinase